MPGMDSLLLRQTLCERCSPSRRAAFSDGFSFRGRQLSTQRQLQRPRALQTHLQTIPVGRRSLHVSAQQTETELSKAELADDIYQVSLRTSEARKSIRFTQTKDGRIVIEAVAIGSEAQQEGIRPGQQLLAISDPIRNNESWNLSIETKLSRVRDALQFRSPPTISLQLTSSSIEDEAGFEWRSDSASNAEESKGNGQDLLSSITGEFESDSSDADKQTVADKLQEQQRAWQAKAAAEEAKYKARVQQRRDYMERESGRNDGPFFALIFALTVLPAAIILVVAWKTGYLASLDMNQHF